jgi:hypothetical protein
MLEIDGTDGYKTIKYYPIANSDPMDGIQGAVQGNIR